MRRTRALINKMSFCLGLLAVLVSESPAAGERFMVNSGTVFFYSNPALETDRIPNWVLMFEIPSTLDTTAEVQEVFCALNAEKVVGDDERRGVRRVLARWTSRLHVLDPSTSQVTVTKIASGRVQTNAEGRGEFTFDIPTELFADGFASGGVSAWTSVTFDLKRNRQSMDSRAECFAVDDL